jgi:hypothetical protein
LNKYSDGTLRDGKLGSAALLAVVVTFSVTTIGSLFVLTLARLRRVQFQRYFIMNRILDACMPLQERNLIAFRSKDIGVPGNYRCRRSSGSHIWTLTLILPSSAFAGIGSGIVIAEILGWGTAWALPLGTAISLAAVRALDVFYLRYSKFESQDLDTVPCPLP